MTQAGAKGFWARMARLGTSLFLLGAGLALAGCQTDNMAASGGSGRTIAFESIDGPPKATFDKLVGELSTEAQTRQVAVVSRTDPAAYRVRGYLSVNVEKGKSKVVYAWDVYDASRQHVMRITGEEVAGSVKGDARSNGWTACDDTVINRIAGESMASLAASIGGSPTRVAPAAEPAASAPAAAEEAPARAPAPTEGDGAPVADAGRAPGVLAYAAQ